LDYDVYELESNNYVNVQGIENANGYVSIQGKEYVNSNVFVSAQGKDYVNSNEYVSVQGKEYVRSRGNDFNAEGKLLSKGKGKAVSNATATDKKYDASSLSNNGNYSRNDLARYNVSGVGILRGKANSASSSSVFIAVFVTIIMAVLTI
ncbi:hypothetical protein BVRB_037080, partial [Beta vulgaris subsp. vulgaris]